MKIIMISELYSPHIGGVEKHIEKLVHKLPLNFQITVITKNYGKMLLRNEQKGNLNIIRINYPSIKYLGILFIWFNLIKNIKKFMEADIIHIHDVFIWYLPLRIILFFKPVYITFHGWEGIYPIPTNNRIQKILANKLTKGSISIGDYINKHYNFQSTYVLYGATDHKYNNKIKKENQIVYLGRLDKDTGIINFLNFIKNNSQLKYKIIFIGKGKYENECKKYGRVIYTSNHYSLLNKSKIIIASGYLSILESIAAKAKVYVSYDNELKYDYYHLSPFNKYLNYLSKKTTLKEFKKLDKKKLNNSYNLSQKFKWNKISNCYLRLWGV